MIRASFACLFLVAAVAGCGYTEVRDQCPACIRFSRAQAPTRVPDGVRTLFVFVPGLLGYGWEWDGPRARLLADPSIALEVYEWSPATPLGRLAHDFAARMNELMAGLPESVTRVFVVGHSAAGMITAMSADRLRVPPGKQLLITNVGTPYAGMHTTPNEGAIDSLWAPFAFTIGGVFTHYPAPAPGVRFESWVTAWPGDPVMKPRFGHDPGDPRVGPVGARHPLPAGTDHNRVVDTVVGEILKKGP